MMVKGKIDCKKIFTTFVSFVMAASLIGGCANSGRQTAGSGNETEQTGGVVTDGGGQTGAQSADSTAMGRYLEEVTDLSDSLEGYRDQLYRMADGTLVITEPMQLMLCSEDQGVTWKPRADAWLDDLLGRGGFIDDYAVGADGTVGIVYEYMEPEEDAATDGNAESGASTDGDKDTDTGVDAGDNADGDTDTGAEADDNADGDNGTDSEEAEIPWWEMEHKEALIVKPDGTEIPVEIAGTGENIQPQHIWISEQGRIFIGTQGAELYEVSEDGSSKVFLTLEEAPQIIQFQGNRMIIDGYDFDSLLIYDLENGEYIEDDVLTDFVNENYGNRSFNGGSWYDLFFFSGEDNILYLAGERGLHRHVIGGSAMEQIIDADLTTFSNPEYRLLGMTALENNEFITIFTDGRLVRFRYDPTVPTVPEETVRVYSLKENNTMRRAISIYQTENPNVYVEYEIGMEENAGVTRDDAIKKLNTEIMAGEGPDLLILDDLPMDSYIEKGLLADVAPLINSIGEENLFARAMDAYRQEGKIYAVPCEISIPIIEGNPNEVSDIDDLEGIADAVEKLRQNHPGKDLIRICSPKGVMKQFAMVCAPAWLTESGELDREMISEFLTQTKRIYDAQMDGLSEEAVRRYEDENEEYVQYYGVTREETDWFGRSTEEMDYVTGERQVIIGVCGGAYTYAEITSVPRTDGFEDNVIVPMNGQCRNVFYVNTLTGINAASAQIGHAEGLLKVLLGDQDISSGGFSVNRNAVESTLFTKEYTSSEDVCSEMTFGYEDGSSFIWKSYWYDEPQADILRGWLQEAQTPYVRDKVLEAAVYEAGTPYLLGETSLEETVAAVEKNMAIYMAE